MAMRPAGTISDAKQTSVINCGFGAVVRHQPLEQSSRSFASLLLIFAQLWTSPRRQAAGSLHFGADRSAGLVGLDEMPMDAKFVMFLGVGQPAHENQTCQHTSGYDVPHHGSHSLPGSAHLLAGDLAAMMTTMDARRQCAVCCVLFRMRRSSGARSHPGNGAVDVGPFAGQATYMRHMPLLLPRLLARGQTAWPKTISTT